MSQTIKIVVNKSIPKDKNFYFFRHLCTKYAKDISIQRTAAPANADFLFQNLKNSTTPKNVLELVSKHYNIMNNKHIMQALRTIFDLQKTGNSDMSTMDLLRNRDFEHLCRKLKRQSGVIELNDTIEALKVISYVGVPSDSVIVQVLLQLVRQNINSLSLHHILFLEFLLSQFKPSPLVEALQIALPLVFDIHLPIKMDRDNVNHLADYLYFAAKTKISESSVDMIVTALCRCNTEFDAKTAKSIIWSITDMEPNAFFEPLLNRAINSLIIHLDELTYNELETTITKLTHKFSRKYPFYYNEVFFDIFANYIIEHDLGFKQAVYLLKKFGRLYHVNHNLLNYVFKHAHEDPELITKGDPSDIYSIVCSVSLTDFRPIHWEEVKTSIINTKNIAELAKRDIIWIKFAASLCLLDIYKIDVLSKALNVDYLTPLFKKKYMSDFENFFAIWQSITLFRPDLSDLLPSKFEPEHLMSDLRYVPEFPLETALEKALGGPQYIKTDLFSKLGAKIDHAILFRKGGYPIAQPSQDYEFIEDIDVPQDSTLVVVLGLRPIEFTINTKAMKESTRLLIKVLEVNGFNVLPVDLDAWKSLNDFEKIPYLMQGIKSKLDSDINVSEGIL